MFFKTTTSIKNIHPKNNYKNDKKNLVTVITDNRLVAGTKSATAVGAQLQKL